MILPVEADDALDALRAARDRLGAAVDVLREMNAPSSTLEPFTQSVDAVSWAVEHVADAIARVSSAARRDWDMETVEERHIESQLLPWADEP